MTCYVMHDIHGEPWGTLCGDLGPACEHCGDVADVQCDFPLGDEGRTCDRNLCERCAPTVGADKNYCREHAEHGVGLLLFRRPLRHEEIVELAELGKRAVERRPRRECTPPAERRWRVWQGIVRGEGCAVLSGWLDEITARAHAAKVGGAVETWDEYVRWFYGKWPRKKRTKKT